MRASNATMQETPGQPVGSAATTPRERDVIVARDNGSSTRHTVGQHPGGGQVSLPTRDQACDLAREFAKAEQLDVWYRRHHAYERLDSFRPKAAGEA